VSFRLTYLIIYICSVYFMLGVAVRYQKVISSRCNNFAAKVSNIHRQRFFFFSLPKQGSCHSLSPWMPASNAIKLP
jgi:hypothetical protein